MIGVFLEERALCARPNKKVLIQIKIKKDLFWTYLNVTLLTETFSNLILSKIKTQFTSCKS